MIDLHCHILPGIDDGAADMDDAAAMASQAAADGIEAVCATPHIRHDHDVLIHELPARVAALDAELRDRGLSVRVLEGGEVAETSLPGLDGDELRTVSLGSGSWILLEPAPGPLSASLLDAVEHLAKRGHGALIAHPERHAGPGWEERLLELIEAGALVQATAAFVEDGEGSPVAPLARRGLVHVLGSDSHSSRAGRPVRLSRGLAGLAHSPRISPYLEWVGETAPRAIVTGAPLRPPFASH